MSKISDDIEAAFRNNDENVLDEVKKAVMHGGLDNMVLGMREFKQQSGRKLSTLLRTEKIHFGGKSWVTGQEAIEETATHFHPKLIDFVIHCMAEGMMVGYNSDDLKEVCHHKWGAVFTDYEDKIELYALTITLDEDARKLVNTLMADCLRAFDHLMGVSKSSGKATQHVWDLWKAALGSSSIAMFMCGQRVGEKWKDEEVLQGILSVTDGE